MEQPQVKTVPDGKRIFLFAYDPWLLSCFLALICFGLVMVTSASSGITEPQGLPALYYYWRHCIAVALGLLVAFAAMKIPTRYWFRISGLLLFVGISLLLLVLIPGIGKEVNGSMRWFRLGPVSLQASEPVKLCVIIYLASYLVRYGDQLKREFAGFLKPVVVLSIYGFLLMLEPDFGATVVLLVTALSMVFLAGISILRFTAWGMVAMLALFSFALLAPYRLQRLMTFMDPWADPYDSGFQLTQALIAFGRGEWFGVGLGNSIQKLFYLPEVHTDFILAVIAEELGFAGLALVIVLFSCLIAKAFIIGVDAERIGRLFSAYLAYGLGTLLGIQTYINMGVNMGVLPTKGLTLPLISYGSNSIIISCLAIGLLLRIDYETRFRKVMGLQT